MTTEDLKNASYMELFYALAEIIESRRVEYDEAQNDHKEPTIAAKLAVIRSILCN